MLYSVYNNRKLSTPHDIRLPCIYLKGWFWCRQLKGFAKERESFLLISGDVTSGCRPNPIYTTYLCQIKYALFRLRICNEKREKAKAFQRKITKVFRKSVIKGMIKNEIKDDDTEGVIEGCTFVHNKCSKHIYFILDTIRVLYEIITS